MAPYFSNKSCDAFTLRASSCTLRNYNNYAINVSQPSDIANGIDFAKEAQYPACDTKHRPRVYSSSPLFEPSDALTLLRSYLGKSVGAGSLAIWTHNLKNIQFLDYKSPHYTRKAYKIGAGVQGHEALEAAQKVGLTVTSGECTTVGFAGGYTQGGGHSL